MTCNFLHQLLLISLPKTFWSDFQLYVSFKLNDCMGVGAAMHLYDLLCLIYDANKIHIIGTECCSLLAYSLTVILKRTFLVK